MSIIELPARMAVGFRFSPTEEELIRTYLKPKLLGKCSEVDQVIAEVDFCQFEPWELPSKSKIKSEDKVWFFFCRQKIECKNKKRSKKKAKTDPWNITSIRRTGKGSWKITSEEREIKDEDTNVCIGKKRDVTFYKRTGERTNWVMQDYYVVPDNPLPNQSTYVLCRVRIKRNKEAKSQKRKAAKPNKEAKTQKRKAGKTSGNINTLDIENPLTPAASSWERSYEEVNEESLPQLLAIQGVHVHPEVNPKLISQTLHSPDRYHNEQEMNLGLPNGLSGVYNFTEALRAADESEECFVNSLIVDPDENFSSGCE